jgi:hypothetical protein
VDELSGKVATGGVVNAYEAISLANAWVPADRNSDFNFVLNTSVSPATSSPGSVSGAGSYKGGTEVTLRAEANFGYTFSHWSGQTVGSDSTLIYNLIADTSVTANFNKSKNWQQAESFGAGWKSLSWIGYYWETDDQGPWVFHSCLEWLYRSDLSLSGGWLYSPTHGWLFNAGQNMPFMYSSDRSSWIYAGEQDLYEFNGSSWLKI